MQYTYNEFKLPSNGKIYPTDKVHIRPKTIFDIKMMLNNPIYNLKAEIDTLQTCLNPNDGISVYDLVNQDVVYLLYMLRGMSDDNIMIGYKGKQIEAHISEMEVKYLQEWNPKRVLPDCGKEVELAYKPIKLIFNLQQMCQEFTQQYPDFQGDVPNVVALLNSIVSFDGSTNKDMIRSRLEQLSWKDSIYLVNEIENLNKLDFGIVEDIEVEPGVRIPIQLNDKFFRPAL